DRKTHRVSKMTLLPNAACNEGGSLWRTTSKRRAVCCRMISRRGPARTMIVRAEDLAERIERLRAPVLRLTSRVQAVGLKEEVLMRKYLAALMAVAGVSVAVIELSCGSSSTQQVRRQTVATGSLAILASDAPLCAVLSLTVTITGATLTPEGDGLSVSVISSSQPLTVDFASLMDFATMLSFS